MTAVGYIAVALFLATLIILLLLGAIFMRDPIVGPLILLTFASLASITPMLFPEPRHWFDAFWKKHISGGKSPDTVMDGARFEGSYRILIYGLPGSGKTSSIKCMLTVSTPHIELCTDEYDVYQDELTISLKPCKKQSVAIADYKGDKPSQIKVHPPEEFFGTDGDRKINAVFFIVDMFPRFTDEMGNPLLPGKTKEVVLESYNSNALKRIKSRVKETEIYMSKWAIEEIFTVAFNKANLQSVRLIINKIDLLRAVVQAECIRDVSVAKVEAFALELFSEIEKNIRRACEENGISDFSCCTVSAATGENVAAMLGQILSVER